MERATSRRGDAMQEQVLTRGKPRPAKLLDLRADTQWLGAQLAALSSGDAWRPRLEALPEEQEGDDAVEGRRKQDAATGMQSADALLSPATRQALQLDLDWLEDRPSDLEDEVESIQAWRYITPGASDSDSNLETSCTTEAGSSSEVWEESERESVASPVATERSTGRSWEDTSATWPSRSPARREDETRESTPGEVLTVPPTSSRSSGDCPGEYISSSEPASTPASPNRCEVCSCDVRHPAPTKRLPPPARRRLQKAVPRPGGFDLSFSAERVREVARDNYRLWRQLQNYKKAPAAPAPPPWRPSKASSGVNRERAQRRIARENEVLRRRLEAVRPVVRWSSR